MKLKRYLIVPALFILGYLSFTGDSLLRALAMTVMMTLTVLNEWSDEKK